MGRLFDAVAALCGFWQEMTFEGQAAMKLEFAAEAEITESYRCRCGHPKSGLIADWEPMIRRIVEERPGANRPAESAPASTMPLPAGLELAARRAIAIKSCLPAVVSRMPC